MDSSDMFIFDCPQWCDYSKDTYEQCLADVRWFASAQPSLRTPESVIFYEERLERESSNSALTPCVKQRKRAILNKPTSLKCKKLQYSSSDDEIAAMLQAHNKKLQQKYQNKQNRKENVSANIKSMRESVHQKRMSYLAISKMQKSVPAAKGGELSGEPVLLSSPTRNCHLKLQDSTPETLVLSPLISLHTSDAVSYSGKLKSSVTSNPTQKQNVKIPTKPRKSMAVQKVLNEQKIPATRTDCTGNRIDPKTISVERAACRRTMASAKLGTKSPHELLKKEGDTVHKPAQPLKQNTGRAQAKISSSSPRKYSAVKTKCLPASNQNPKSLQSKAVETGKSKPIIRNTLSTKSAAQKPVRRLTTRDKPKPDETFNVHSNVLAILNSKTPLRGTRKTELYKKPRHSVETPSPPLNQPSDSDSDLDVFLREKLKAHNANIAAKHIAHNRIPGSSYKCGAASSTKVSLHLGSPSRPRMRPRMRPSVQK